MRQIALAIRGLAGKVRMISQRMNASVSRTIGRAVGLLASLTGDIDLGTRDSSVAPSIMVLDDIAMVRRLHCSALERVSRSGVPADDPSRAVEMFEHKHFDVVDLDVHM